MSVGKTGYDDASALEGGEKRLSSQIPPVSKRTISKAKETSEGHDGFFISLLSELLKDFSSNLVMALCFRSVNPFSSFSFICSRYVLRG